MYYFIGIKGSGMTALATILYELGYTVCGSDIDKYIFTEEELHKRDIPVYSFDENNIKDGYTVIIGNSFKDDHIEVKTALKNKSVTCFRYAEFLGSFMNRFDTIAIAGTHGKTTTTGMAYQLFKDFDKTSVLIGDGTGYALKDSKYFIAESCEFQDHFLHYHPKYAVINNIELDHVDYFGTLENCIASFEKFANQATKAVIVWGDDPNIKKINFKKQVLRFGLDKENDIYATNVMENEEGLAFDVFIHKKLFGHFKLPYFGKHMLYNSLAIITLGYLENMEFGYMEKQMQTFTGAKRRYTVTEIGHNVYVDDYAHHPTAISFVIEATRTRYPNKKIVAIFKPDRFSRGAQFAQEFANALSLADYAYFCHFPNNAMKEEGYDIDIYDIAKYLPSANVIDEEKEGAKTLAQHDGVVFLFMSSKDIYKLQEKVINIKKNTI